MRLRAGLGEGAGTRMGRTCTGPKQTMLGQEDAGYMAWEGHSMTYLGMAVQILLVTTSQRDGIFDFQDGHQSVAVLPRSLPLAQVSHSTPSPMPFSPLLYSPRVTPLLFSHPHPHCSPPRLDK